MLHIKDNVMHGPCLTSTDDAAGLANFAFTLSPRFADTQNETALTRRVFRDEQTVCNLGNARFAEELAEWLNISITDNFAAAACRLPEVYSRDIYMDFLDDWGTHMTMEVDLGTRVIQRSETSMLEFVHLVERTSGEDLRVGGSYLGFGASLEVNFPSFTARDVADLTFGNYVATLRLGSQAKPEPISIKIASIDHALDPRYWWRLPEMTAHGLCNATFDPNVTATNLRRALSDYAAYKMALEVTDPPLRIPLSWPRGTYGLMKAVSGCPTTEESRGLRAGVTRTQRILSHRTKFLRPFILQIMKQKDDECHRCPSATIPNCGDVSEVGWGHVSDGEYGFCYSGIWVTDGNLRLEFCIKGTDQVSEWDVDWPAGDYCILKYKTCPAGFKDGFIQFNDQDILQTTRREVPCLMACTTATPRSSSAADHSASRRNDASPTVTQPLYLPPSIPFFLVRYSGGCPFVHNMAVREETVWWDEAINTVFSPSPRQGGAHPFDDGDSSNHRLHFCYYSPNGSNPDTPVG
ncbi:hypothetical protein C0Q70_12763 [Pomacea canaliculata]|uniref:MACPF domain-containing protein n=1 Tax=Pomacea canaliculata TaxID=400727 RepID=A0A2T7P2F5_POMCA|nr:hypothetical protein C0Q70_12763 [Pomacea canaliculata]